MLKQLLLNKQRQHGMTLVELLVASGIIILLMGMLSVLLAKTFFINKYSIEQGLNNAQLQGVIKHFSANVREARQSDAGDFLLKTAEKNDLVFYADVDDDPDTERVHYYLDGTFLMMGLANASGFPPAYPANDEETRIIGSGIINTEEQPLFYYYNKDYPQDRETNPMTTPAAPDQVNIIHIHLFANIDPNHVPDHQEMESFVKPRNISTVSEYEESGLGYTSQIEVTPLNYNFGSVRQNTDSESRFFTISSVGAAILYVGDIALSSTTHYSLDLNGGPFPCGTATPAIGVSSSCTVAVTFRPTSTGNKTANLTIQSDDPSNPTATVALSGTGIAPNIVLNPTSKNYGNVNVGSSSSAQTITISNTGTASLDISSMALSDGNHFSLNVSGGSSPCGQTTPTIAAGSSCTVSVTFNPQTAGAKSATLGIVSNDPAHLISNVSLSGTGVAPDISISPSSKDYGSVKQNTNSSAQVFTISNNGNASLNVSNIVLSDTTNYSLSLNGGSPNCSSTHPTISAGSNCKISVTFTPKSTGTKNATLTITSNDPADPSLAVSLTGFGSNPQISLDPTSKNFGNVKRNTSSAAQMITISSTGTGNLNVSNMTLSDSTNYSLNIAGGTNPCNSFNPSIPSGSSCTISVTFNPKSSGTKNATLTIASDATNLPSAIVTLTGVGTDPNISVSPTSINFGNVKRYTYSSPQTVTISNTGGAELNVSNIYLASSTHYDLDLNGGANPCGSTTPVVNAGSSCTVHVIFNPQQTNNRTTTLYIESDDPDLSSVSVSLTGRGTN